MLGLWYSLKHLNLKTKQQYCLFTSFVNENEEGQQGGTHHQNYMYGRTPEKKGAMFHK